MITLNDLSQNRALRGSVVALGACAVALAALRLPAGRVDVPFLLLSLVAVNAGTRLRARIPRTNAAVTHADTLLMVTLLVYGGELSVVLAAVCAVCASIQPGRTPFDALRNAAAASGATFLVAAALRLSFGAGDLSRSLSPSSLAAAVCAVCIAALVQTVFRAVVAGGEGEGRGGSDGARGAGFAWTLGAYLAVNAAALVIAELIVLVGFYGALAFTLACAFVHFAAGVYLRGINDSVTRARQIESRVVILEESEGLFHSAFDHAAIGMAIVSASGQLVQVNRSLCEMLGYEEAELLASHFQQITHPDDLGNVLASIKELLRGRAAAFHVEKRFLHKQGHPVWVLCSVSRVRERATDRAHLIFQTQDITDRKRAEERLLHDAFHDALTGLPNRSLFIDHLKLAIARRQRDFEQNFAVLFLDLDRFKIINDSLGHMIGDQLLVGIARRLETCLRPGDTVARVGGDEFTILLEGVRDEAEAVTVAERIQAELSLPFYLSGREVFTTSSIGIAPGTTDYALPEEVLRDADTAMYRAKSLGKARHEVFDKEMHAVAMNLLQMETDLRGACERGEFFLEYQAIVSLEDFGVKGFEALVRWEHPERGTISPMDFIPVAEESGQVVAIGQWALGEACRRMQQWQHRFPADPPLFISVNLSIRQFNEPRLIEQVEEILVETGLDPRSLKLEITESAVMEDIDAATGMLEQLRALGVQLSIDDFGTGYSSLSYLHRFPINTLKVDRSFVMRMADNNENSEIVRTILMLAQNLGMDVVAEGVETREQLALLRKLGCEYGQGFLFSKPVDADGAEQIIAETRAVANHAPAEPEAVSTQAV
ncbi:MAG TPA: EAL domain-containing protein [Pyrinomonadaceae bacterium]|jgi:diguanylate cyclase (GGDEF)-like protein/PAS domain S-box-containing protein